MLAKNILKPIILRITKRWKVKSKLRLSKKGLKTPMDQSEAVNRRTDNTIAKKDEQRSTKHYTNNIGNQPKTNQRMLSLISWKINQNNQNIFI